MYVTQSDAMDRLDAFLETSERKFVVLLRRRVKEKWEEERSGERESKVIIQKIIH